MYLTTDDNTGRLVAVEESSDYSWMSDTIGEGFVDLIEHLQKKPDMKAKLDVLYSKDEEQIEKFFSDVYGKERNISLKSVQLTADCFIEDEEDNLGIWVDYVNQEIA